MKSDVLIVGGGPAGLSAALILGRCYRKVLLCDEGHQRNLSSHVIHGLLGREGGSPAVFLDQARQELSCYKSVAMRGTRVTEITPTADGFEFVCADGTTGSASKVLLATGLVDELPELAGIEPLYGVSVHHCLYCDGFEYASKPVAALGKGDKGAELAIMMKHWMADVVACSDGTEVSAQTMRKLKRHNIPLRSEPIHSLEGSDGKLTRIVFASGPELLGPVCFSRPAAIRRLTFPSGLAASAARKEASSQIPILKKQVSRAYMSRGMCRATFFLLQWPSRKARRRLSPSTRLSCAATVSATRKSLALRFFLCLRIPAPDA